MAVGQELVVHPFSPVVDGHSRVLILGSLPSVKSRENHFYYGHPQNRFWKVLAGVCQAEVPVSVEEKKAFLLANGIAVWDVIASCRIVGSSDSSIRDVAANDVAGLCRIPGLRRCFATAQSHGSYITGIVRRHVSGKRGSFHPRRRRMRHGRLNG